MPGGRDRILRALEELSGSELRRLKAELNRAAVPAALGTIPRGTMEDADALDLTQLLVGRYREAFAAVVTARALRSIHRRDLADTLEAGDGPTEAFEEFPALSPGEAFVSRHRAALVGRTRAVSAILDHLQAAGAISREDAAFTAAAPTPQEQMRRLLDGASAWGPRGHRVFLHAMRELQPCLMEQLEGEDQGGDWGDHGPGVNQEGPGGTRRNQE
ncbi:apoptosis-associated speck-like protein containing a CARD [Phaenicophaeus curvirostris]|uniref:apoptosis-associated speck-like protein containing a CARD n=1 Tax=Phaenicophaeus curvirostris TaxID=33595 RepID=UPI0037F0F2EE